jgi:hypothetical protein
MSPFADVRGLEIVLGIPWCLVMYGVIVCEWLPLLLLPHSALELPSKATVGLG